VSVIAIAREIVTLAVNGLQTVAPDEVSHLDVLRQQVVDEAISSSDILLRNWRGRWNGSMNQVIEYLRIA